MRLRIITPIALVLCAAACEPELEVESRIRVGPPQPPAPAPAPLETPPPAPPPALSLPPADSPVAVPEIAADECDPNYDPCVPIASDVDCAGGSGNGPAYVQGPVRVIGRDVYKLDRDGDGMACDR